jgi:hypothetical protein
MNAVASSEHRVASRPSRHFYILRARIRNAEALLAHYGEWTGEHLAGHCATSPELASMEAVLRRLRALREELLSTDAACSQPGAGRPACAVAGLISPTATASHEESLAGSLVTPTAALSGNPDPSFDPDRPF